MSENKTALLILKGMRSELSEDQRQEVDDACEEIKAIARRSDLAKIGLSIAVAEIALEQE